MRLNANIGPHMQLSDLLSLSLRAARAGAAAVLGLAAPRAVGFKSSETDPVTEADRASEAAIRRVIAAERPNDGFLAEDGTCCASSTGLRWVCDPLDGTVNYLYGIPHWAVSIACEVARGDAWESLSAVVHDPTRSETFSAVRGGGAHLGGSAIACRDPDGPSLALLATGFSYRAQSRARQAEAVRRLLPRVRDLRSTGSSALDLCWTAAGRFDAFLEDELPRWDWAAGALIVREAGGLVSQYESGVLAASPGLHAQLSQILMNPDGRES